MGAIFTCSIDDGHPSDMRLADLLERYGLNGTFYVPIVNREGSPVMAPAALRELAGRFEIGSHTYSHQFLTRVDATRAAQEIFWGKHALEDMLGRPVSGFCYPGGRYRRVHLRMVRAAGFSYARTTVNLCLDAGPGRYEMATSCQFYPHGRDVYMRNFASGGRWLHRRRCLAAFLRSSDWRARLYKCFEIAETHNRVFHLWAHTADLDSNNSWSEMENFLSHVSGSVKTSNRLSNRELAERYFIENMKGVL